MSLQGRHREEGRLRREWEVGERIEDNGGGAGGARKWRNGERHTESKTESDSERQRERKNRERGKKERDR